jgi:diguanylate cyclase (GGDEF)-like protein
MDQAVVPSSVRRETVSSRILVILGHRENGRLLQHVLEGTHEVLLAETAEQLQQPFDLAIVDGLTVSQHRAEITDRRQSEHPVLLPFLLVTSGNDSSEAIRHLWQSIDELIRIPIDRTELQARVEILLRMRALSLELAERYENEKKLAMTDDVTGFYNVRYLYQFLDEQLPEAAATGASLSLAFVDMDNFKSIVDTHGHLSGSKVLREVAELFGHVLEERDRLVHYGGDEYVIVLPNQDRAAALTKVARLQAGLQAARFLQAEELHVAAGASFGVATYPDDAADVRSLLAAADQLLFQSKVQGKNRISQRA